MADTPSSAGASPEALLSALWAIQETYGAALNRKWQAHLKPALEALRTSRGAFRDKMRAVDRAAVSYGRRDDVGRLAKAATKESYIAGALFIQARAAQLARRRRLPAVEGSLRVDKAAPVKATRAIASYSLNLEDRRAIDALEEVHLLWFRKGGAAYLDTGAVGVKAKEILESGRSGLDVANALHRVVERHYGVGFFAEKGLNYWAGVAEHASTTAGISGQLRQMVELGFTRYTVTNPVDERTTKVCQAMNGKTLLVSDGVRNLDKMLEASSVEGVIAAKPFVSGGSPAQLERAIGERLSAGDKDLSAKQSGALAAAGFAMPPYHFRCRSYVDVASE